MKHSDFAIGLRFQCGGRGWLVTDIGTRTVIAVQLGEREELFNEDDIAGCVLAEDASGDLNNV